MIPHSIVLQTKLLPRDTFQINLSRYTTRYFDPPTTRQSLQQGCPNSNSCVSFHYPINAQDPLQWGRKERGEHSPLRTGIETHEIWQQWSQERSRVRLGNGVVHSKQGGLSHSKPHWSRGDLKINLKKIELWHYQKSNTWWISYYLTAVTKYLSLRKHLFWLTVGKK